MAEKREQEAGIHELRQEIAHSRDRLRRDLDGLGYELDFPLKFRKSFQRNAGVWISAAVLTGVAYMARALPRKKIIYTTDSKTGHKAKGEEQKKGLLQAGLVMGGLRLVASLARPFVVSFVRQKLGGYVAGRGTRGR